MNKKFTVSGIVTLILGLATFMWLLFHIYQLRADLLGHFQSSHGDFLVVAVAGYLAMLLFHAAAFLFLFMRTRYTKQFGAWWAGVLGLGIISLFAIAAEKVMYDEIGRELAVEYAALNETYLLLACLGVNLLFSIVMMMAVFRSLSTEYSTANAPSNDERVFTMTNVMGIVSGITGLLLTFSLIEGRRPVKQLWVFIPFYLLFLTPYAFAVLYWLAMKWRERLADWYDEKQVRDIMKASLATLVLSVPGLAILTLIPRPLSHYWFPYYLFLILSLFSTSTLYYFKRE